MRNFCILFLIPLALSPSVTVSQSSQDHSIKETSFDITLPEGVNNISTANHEKVVVCALNTWAFFRQNEGEFNITKDTRIGHLCTHIIYRTALIHEKTFDIYFGDLNLHKKMGYFADVISMKSKYPHLKIILSLGSWTLDKEIWAALIDSSENRTKFINNSLEFLRNTKASGINLDWEYPTKDQKPLFTLLAKEMQYQFKKEGFILTATIWSRMTQLVRSYEISEITRIFDLVLVKFFDLHPDHAIKTGHISPLRSHTLNNIQGILEYLIKEKANPEKMVLGIPFFGRPYLLKNISSLRQNAGWNEPSDSGEYPAPWNRDGKFNWGYNEICFNYSKERQLPWKIYWDEFAKVPIMVNSKGRWMTFDNMRSIFEKVALAQQFGLKGIMAWTVDMDDFGGYCGQGSHPLLTFINYALSTISPTASKLCSFIQSQNVNNFYKPIVTTNIFNLSVTRNSELKFQCTVQGYPPSKIRWIKSKKSWMTQIEKVPQNIKCHPYDEIQVSTMKIAKFKTSDAGMYTCEAENDHGKSSRVFYLKEYSQHGGNAEQGTPWGWISFGIVVLLLCIMSIFGFLVYRRMMIIIMNGMTKEEIQEFLEGSKHNNKNGDQAPETLPYDNSYELSAKQYDIDKENILGSGAFGIVYKGRVNEVEVAVKATKPGADKQYLLSLLSELKILSYLGHHTNVVNLVGASTPELKQGVVYMFVELCHLGNLLDYLRKCRKSFVHNLKSSDQVTKEVGETDSVTTNDLYIWSVQIAKALLHLHSKNVIHGDLAARNILVFDKNVVKITDFGLSRKLYEYSNYVKKNQEPLPWRWMAIESLKDLTFSFKSDIWAYGITLWEIFSLGEVPYPGLTWTTDFVENLSNDLRCHKPKYSSDSLYNIMLKCWQENPDHRPRPEEIIKHVSEMLNNYSGTDYVDVSNESKKS